MRSAQDGLQGLMFATQAFEQAARFAHLGQSLHLHFARLCDTKHDGFRKLHPSYRVHLKANPLWNSYSGTNAEWPC